MSIIPYQGRSVGWKRWERRGQALRSMYDWAQPWIAKAQSYYGGRGKRKRSFKRRATWRPGEKKFIDTTVSASINNAAGFTDLLLIPQGLDRCDRIGNKVNLVSLFFRCTLQKHTTATVTLFRMMIFSWDDNTAPVISDILDATTMTSLTALNKQKKFILMDKVIVLNQNFDGQATMRTWSKFKKLKMTTHFDGAGTTTGQTGRLFLLIFSNEGTNLPTFTMEMRVRYRDP